jgi:hypothetical protein
MFARERPNVWLKRRRMKKYIALSLEEGTGSSEEIP